MPGPQEFSSWTMELPVSDIQTTSYECVCMGVCVSDCICVSLCECVCLAVCLSVCVCVCECEYAHVEDHTPRRRTFSGLTADAIHLSIIIRNIFFNYVIHTLGGLIPGQSISLTRAFFTENITQIWNSRLGGCAFLHRHWGWRRRLCPGSTAFSLTSLSYSEFLSFISKWPNDISSKFQVCPIKCSKSYLIYSPFSQFSINSVVFIWCSKAH